MSDISPNVFLREGKVFANSRDVAAYFEKAHFNVLQDIDKLVGILKSQDTPSDLFVPVSTVNEQNKVAYRSFNMTRDGFTLLAMGFTGAKALQFKLRYIEAFNRMEEALRQMTALPPMQPETDLPLTDRRLWLDEIALCLRVKGRAAARRLWDISPLTQIPDEPVAVQAVRDDADDALACFQHLLDWPLKLDGADHRLADLVAGCGDSARIHALLRDCGLHMSPRGWDGYVGIANHATAAPALARHFATTKWAGCWGQTLQSLPGARRHPSTLWFTNTAARAVLVPIGMFGG